MSKRYVSDVVKCPWYKCEDRQRIFCEGPMPGSSIHVAFSTPESRRDYERALCKTMDYAKCIVAQGHGKQWEG